MEMMEMDYSEVEKQRAVKIAKDMIEQRGGPEDCEPFYDDDLRMVRFEFDPQRDYNWVYPDGSKAPQHPGELFESMTDDEQPMFLEIYRCHRFDDPMYGLFNADIMTNDEFVEMANPDELKDLARGLISVADGPVKKKIEAMKHWRKE